MARDHLNTCEVAWKKLTVKIITLFNTESTLPYTHRIGAKQLGDHNKQP